MQHSSLAGVSNRYLHMQCRWNFKLYFNMARRKLSDAERWQAVGMVRGDISYKTDCWTIQCKPLCHCSIEAACEPNREVKEFQRTGRSLKMTPREGRLLKMLTRQQPFSTTNTLRSRWIVNGCISRQTVNRRLNSARFRARKPIKRPLLTIRHNTARLQWARDHMGWNIRSWQRMHWSDESRFFVESSWWLRPRIESNRFFIDWITHNPFRWWHHWKQLEQCLFKLFLSIWQV